MTALEINRMAELAEKAALFAMLAHPLGDGVKPTHIMAIVAYLEQQGVTMCPGTAALIARAYDHLDATARELQ